MKPSYESWKRKTRREEAAISSLNTIKKLILENIPREKVVAIYAGGSFVMREMGRKSDVDTWTIVKDNSLLKKLDELHSKYREKYKPNLGISGLSLWELENNKRYLDSAKLKANPSRFLKNLDHYFLVYGKPIRAEDYKVRSDAEDYKALVGTFKKTFLPAYEKGEIGFSGLVKQLFWVVNFEQRTRGIKPPYSFLKLEKSIKDKKHIIHEAIKFRKKKIKDAKIRARFVERIKKYINSL